MFRDRQTDNSIFDKFKTYLDGFFMPEIYVIPNFMKIVRAVLGIHKSSWTDSQTDNPILYKAETYLDFLFMIEIYVVPNFLKIVRAVLEIYESCFRGQTDRQPDILQG